VTDTMNLQRTVHTSVSADTSAVDDVFIVVGSHPASSLQMVGAWSDAGWGLAWPEGAAQDALESPEVRALAPRGFVLENIQLSEECVISRWLPSALEHKQYKVRAFVTAGTLDLGHLASGGFGAGLARCRSIFQRAGFVDITLPMRTRQLFVVNTELRPENTGCFVSSQDIELSEYGWETLSSASSSSSRVDPGQTNLEDDILRAISSAAALRFEEGIESDLSRTLRSIIEKDSKSAVTVLTKALNAADANVVADTLRLLGRIEDPNSADERRWLMEANLTSRSPLVRDVAISSLAALADPRSLPALRAASSQERIDALRADIDDVIAELEREERTKAS
jgi:hypothetical protein